MKKIIRTNHPVGCAAFNTEIFVDDNTNKRFNVVYDCGYGTGCNHAKFRDFVEEVFSPTENLHIDYLFLSHFDSDHLDGLFTLVFNGLITEKTISFLPLIRPQHLSFIEPFAESNYHLTVLMLNLLGSRIVFIESIGQGKNEFPERSQTLPIQGYPIEELNDLREDRDGSIAFDEHVNFDATFGGYSKADDFVNDILGEVKNNIKTNFKSNKAEQILIRIPVPNFNWEYIPFYVQPDWVLDNFYDIVKDEYPSFIGKLSQFPFKWDAKDRNTLKYLYKERIGDDYEKACNVTRINMNSMMLLSQPQHDYKEYDTEFSFGRISYRTNVATPSCIYTADVGLKEDNFFIRLEEFAKKLAIKPLDLLQIPHHGSVHCYNQKIYSSDNLRMRNSFVNGNPESKNPKFDTQVLIDSSLAGVQCCVVYDNTSLKQTYNLDQGILFYKTDFLDFIVFRNEILNIPDYYLSLSDELRAKLINRFNVCIIRNKILSFKDFYEMVATFMIYHRLHSKDRVADGRFAYEIALLFLYNILKELNDDDEKRDKIMSLIPINEVYVHNDIAEAAQTLLETKDLSKYSNVRSYFRFRNPCYIIPKSEFSRWLPGFKGYMIEIILMVFKEEILNGRFRLSLLK